MSIGPITILPRLAAKKAPASEATTLTIQRARGIAAEVSMPTTNLVVTCHPHASSLCARIARMTKDVLEGHGEVVLIDDLSQSGFDPVISSDELRCYYRCDIPNDLESLVAHIRQAQHVIFIYPVWMYDMPALLKGYFERVWRPHVAYRMEGDLILPLLVGIKRLIVIATHGRNEAEAIESGDCTRDFFARSLPTLLPNLVSNARFDIYALDTPSVESIECDLDAIRRHLDAIGSAS